MVNKKAENCSEHVDNLFYQKLGCNVYFKILFLNYQGDIFLENCGALNNEHGVCFHHFISAVEKTYQAKWSSPMFVDCCWMVTRISPGLVYKQVKMRHN